MGLFYNDTVTLYNRFYDAVDDVEKWYPTVFTDCNLVINHGANISKSGLESADAASLRVTDNCSEKEYKEPKEWDALTLSEKENFYTFKAGEDFYVKGNTTNVTIIEENFYQWMSKHRDNVFRLTNADRYTDIMPHFEVGGK